MLASIRDAALGLTLHAMQWLFRGSSSTLPAPAPAAKQPARQGAEQDAVANQRKLMQYHELAQACTGIESLANLAEFLIPPRALQAVSKLGLVDR